MRRSAGWSWGCATDERQRANPWNDAAGRRGAAVSDGAGGLGVFGAGGAAAAWASRAAGDGPAHRRWAKAVAECVARGECTPGGVVFYDDPALVCCVANKLPGLRAAARDDGPQAARATLDALGVNLLAVRDARPDVLRAMRQMVRLLCGFVGLPRWAGRHPTRELDGYAHR